MRASSRRVEPWQGEFGKRREVVGSPAHDQQRGRGHAQQLEGSADQHAVSVTPVGVREPKRSSGSPVRQSRRLARCEPS